MGGVFDTRFGVDAEYSIALCPGCGLEQTHPVPSSQELKQLYEAHYNFGGEKGTLYTRARELFLFSILYRAWMCVDGDISFHSMSGAGRLLDIGCNEGRGLKMYRNNGFQAEGLELNEVAAATAKAAGFPVSTLALADYCPAEKYDAVILSNVLEHSVSPKVMLSQAVSLLNPGGRIHVSCPNSRSILRSIFGRYWINWHVPFHISHFSPAVLSALLKDAGFKNIQTRCETPALWVSHSAIAWLTARRGEKTKALRNPILVLSLMLLSRAIFFPVWFVFNRLGRGDCLIVTAVRR